MELELDQLAFIGLAVLAAGGLFYALVYPYLSGDAKADDRLDAVAGAKPAGAKQRGKSNEPARPRTSVEDTLKEIELRQKNAKRPPLHMRISQAGLDWPKKKYYIFCGILAVVGFVATLLAGLAPLWALFAAVVMGLGLPEWILGFLKKKRMAAFLEELANAVDVIVRGVKAGLPLGDCLRIVAAESQEPVKTEFRFILEQTAMGIPMHEAVMKLYERMPVAEANFFCIVVSIQQRAGGNLSETLGNLSKVLRDRKKMKAKIVALSQEAKASAGIIGCLPPGVMLFVYMSTPQYISLLWTTDSGRMMLVACVVWMLIGVLVMRKMINFDF